MTQGMRLDPAMAAIVPALDPLYLVPENALRAPRDIPAPPAVPLPVDPRVIVFNAEWKRPRQEEPLRVRIYQPHDAGSAAPVLLYLHGGAFIFGDVYQEEARCLRYAVEADCWVVSVEYRLAPEHPYPEGVEDCYDALLALHSGVLGDAVDCTRIAIAGASAGGALAAAVALMARDRNGPTLRGQLLIYPVLDDRLDTPSMREFQATPIWNTPASALMWRHYLGATSDPPAYAAPARAESLEHLPPSMVVTAEYDPLRDEGIEYARRLLYAHVPTELNNVTGALHGFDIVALGTPLAERSLRAQVEWLRSCLSA